MPTKTTYTADYRKIWIDAYGPIPKDHAGRTYEIHHIDGDKTNNSLENLACISIQEHYYIHLSKDDYRAANLIGLRMKLSAEELSENMKGERNPMFGKTGAKHPRFGIQHTQETKNKIGEANRGNQPRLGAILSEETKNKIGDANRGKKRTAAQKAVQSKNLIGRPVSEATKDKMSKSAEVYTYLITYPDGYTEQITNLRQFCKENGLDQGNMSRVAKNKASHCKRYKVKILAS